MTEPLPHPWGVGMPEWLKLQEFGRIVTETFGARPWLVGSSLETKMPRDVDVRLVLTMKEWARLGPASDFGKAFTPWSGICLAFSALGREMTGLRVDFQIQTTAISNVYADRPRRELGIEERQIATEE